MQHTLLRLLNSWMRVRQGSISAAAIFGLRDVIEDKHLLGMAVDEANRFAKLVLDDEQIIGKAGIAYGADAAVEVCAIEEALRLGLHYVT